MHGSYSKIGNATITGLMLLLSAIKKNNVQILGNKESENTIVFGHGFGSDSTSWRFIQKAFELDYRLITYDNVGAGHADHSAYSHDKYTKLSTYANDLVDICDDLAVKDATFVGHSMSGMIGLLASKQEPEFFDKHVFMNASPRYLNDNNYKGGFEQSDLDSLYQAMAINYQSWVGGFAHAAMANSNKPDLAFEFARTLSTVRPDTAMAVVKAIFESDLRNEIKGFAKESLIVQSWNDIAVPMAVGEYIKEQLPNSKLVKIDAQGHFPHISAPEEVIHVLQTFL